MSLFQFYSQCRVATIDLACVLGVSAGWLVVADPAATATGLVDSQCGWINVNIERPSQTGLAAFIASRFYFVSPLLPHES